jgi:hypothetical protein
VIDVAMMEKLRMFFINKLKTKKSGTRPGRRGSILPAQYEKSAASGGRKFPGRAPYRANRGD